VIVGGESGPGARPCDVAWIRSIVEQCRAAGVPAFCKQLGADPCEAIPGKEETRAVNAPFMGGGWSHLTLRDRKGGDLDEWPEDLRVREFPS
jgi:protein gp37